MLTLSVIVFVLVAFTAIALFHSGA